jgi:hypothetical protein
MFGPNGEQIAFSPVNQDFGLRIRFYITQLLDALRGFFGWDAGPYQRS